MPEAYTPEQLFESQEPAAVSERTLDFSSLQVMLETIKQIPDLSRAEECELARQAHAGDRDAYDRLVLSGLPHVVHAAKRFRYLGVPFEDLIQEGSIALMRAAEKFDPAKGSRFNSYAKFDVVNSLSRTITKHGKIIPVSEQLDLAIRQIEEIEGRYLVACGRVPTPEELLEELGEDAAKDQPSLEFIQTVRKRSVISLDHTPTDPGLDDYSSLAD